MRKIARILLFVFVMALAVVACKKNTVPQKQQETKEENKENNNEQTEEVKLAVDGKFGEWADVSAVDGDEELSGLLLMKTQVTDSKLFFYIEADAELMDTDAVPYANYLTLCLDCGDAGSEKISYWGGETGAAYDMSISIWLMTNGRANMAAWDYGFTGKGKIDGGIYKGEFSLNRSSDERLKSKSIYYGAYLTNQTVEKDDEGNEVWLEGITIGVAPAQGEDMAKVK